MVLVLLGNMPSIDVEKRISDFERILANQETALAELSEEIKKLKTDVRELLNLMRLVGALFQRPIFGIVQENPEKEFEKRLRATLEEHGIQK
jgi:uncharacterized coiled-coil protein SlyX